jgi:hypothetical protein
MTVFRAIFVIMLALSADSFITIRSQAQQLQLRNGGLTPNAAVPPQKLPKRHADPARAKSLPAVQPNPGVQPNGSPLAQISLSSLSATRERPIFSPSRRPSTGSKPPPLAQNGFSGNSRPPLTLLGVIAGGEPGMAVFLDGNSRAVIRMKVGERRSGWTLHSVKWREATLVRDQHKVVLAIPNAASK